MPEYIEREAVHRLVSDCTKYRWTSPTSSESRTTVSSDDVNFGVDRIPAADVEPVRHGQWVHTDFAAYWFGKNECSECHYHEEEQMDISHYRYCPNCGAKMDMKG